MTKKIIEVVGAAIIKEEKVLAMQRSEQMTLPGMWEFPGGKVEADETEQEALIREIKEELNVTINILDYINEASYDYEFGTVQLKVYTAEIISGQITLEEHSDGKWVTADELKNIDWAPVDIPAAKALVKIL
ncbi:MAG TPA: (deoxy)nucleoside triphosphate pyrophosphohydrolase [Atopostipes sp.]|nr:(deoxy)nucleoside triphosphate pyrophosphohydrolase [Atopostipes sp.]